MRYLGAMPHSASRALDRRRPPRADQRFVHEASHLVLSVRLPDRPGALGAVASRIGAVGADITDVVVARRSDGSALDVFHLTLPATDVDVLSLLVQELREVDGAAIESWSAASCCDDLGPADEAPSLPG